MLPGSKSEPGDPSKISNSFFSFVLSACRTFLFLANFERLCHELTTERPRQRPDPSGGDAASQVWKKETPQLHLKSGATGSVSSVAPGAAAESERINEVQHQTTVKIKEKMLVVDVCLLRLRPQGENNLTITHQVIRHLCAPAPNYSWRFNWRLEPHGCTLFHYWAGCAVIEGNLDSSVITFSFYWFSGGG